MTIDVRKVAYLQPDVIDAGGRPLCPGCADPMEEVQPGEWMCPAWAPMWRAIFLANTWALASSRSRPGAFGNAQRPKGDN